MDPRSTVRLSDARALRAYAHPIRMKLVGLLRREGPLTATRAAELLGESSGTTSFHLRQLAKYGLVEEAGGGAGRQRPWRATAMFTNLPDVVTAEITQASTQLRSLLATHYYELMLDWIARLPEDSVDWQRATPASDYMLYLTANELKVLASGVEALMEPYAERVADRDARPKGSRLVTYLNVAMPDGPTKEES